MAEPRTAVLDYLERFKQSNSGGVEATTGIRRLVRRAMGPETRFGLRRAATHVVVARERRKASQIRRPFRLHLASGDERKEGWVNVDLLGHPVDVAWDLSRPLPFPDESIESIFSEHFLGYLSVADGFRMLTECYRLLRPGGVLRTGVPDCGHPEVAWESTPTAMLGLNLFFASDPAYRTMYDSATLLLLTEAAGFKKAWCSPPGASTFEVVPDTPARRHGTLYVEAIR